MCPIAARVAVLALLTGVPALRAQAQQGLPASYTGIAVEASPQIFATMCALDAAGFGADEGTLAEMPARLALRADLLRMQGPATQALREFYHDHVLADPGETLSRYITFALVIGPPPQFRFQVDRDMLPPDVLAIEGFQEILANFYREAHLDLRWARIQPEYEPAIGRYQAPIRRIVTVSNAYLREILKPSNGRTFTVYVEPLVGHRTNFRNSGNSYGIVVGTGPEIPLDDVQHAYLHYLLDPLLLRNRPLVERKSALLNIAARAPRFPPEYQTDFLAFTDECLIRAVELRLRRLAPGPLEAALRDADQSGFTLERPLVQQLQKFEKAEPAMSYYFPDLISGIDVQAEQKRLQSAAFAAADPAPAPKPDVVSAEDHPSDLDRSLAEGDHEIAVQDAPAAAATFEKVLEKYPNQPRALYGLAIASVLSGKASRAEELFEKLVSAPAAPGSEGSNGPVDPALVAWSHVYLGRIHDLKGQRDDLQNERDLAVDEYRAALAVDGAPESARVAAQGGVAAPYKPPASDNRQRNP